MLTFRNNFAVSFNRDALAGVTQQVNELSNGCTGRNIARLAVELDVHGEAEECRLRRGAGSGRVTVQRLQKQRQDARFVERVARVRNDMEIRLWPGTM